MLLFRRECRTTNTVCEAIVRRDGDTERVGIFVRAGWSWIDVGTWKVGE